jgi:hypothetical protein
MKKLLKKLSNEKKPEKIFADDHEFMSFIRTHTDWDKSPDYLSIKTIDLKKHELNNLVKLIDWYLKGIGALKNN